MRIEFFQSLHKEMATDKNIVLVSADLGFFLIDHIRKDFPDRFYNVGAAEMAMITTAIGLSLSGKTVFCYSITPFLILRPFEAIRTYINHEKIPVILCGSGRDQCYLHDGISHFATDIPELMATFKNINSLYPETAADINLRQIIESKQPTFLSLKR